ncbi:MAG: CRTAC1 family protein [Planctomycetes bacterium]|nr:CRTAC1 family protein [Planctomycetota bacterium]
MGLRPVVCHSFHPGRPLNADIATRRKFPSCRASSSDPVNRASCCGIAPEASKPANNDARIGISVTPVIFAICFIACGCSRSLPESESRSEAKQKPPATETIPVRPAGLLPVFREVSETIGVRFVRNDDIRGQHRLLEANGGGVGLSDFDNDGWPDIFLTNGCRLPLRERDPSGTNALFLSRGSGEFREVTAEAGLASVGYWQGCTCGDFDGDGFEDLYVAAFGQNALFHNQGDGTFLDVAAVTGTAVGKWSSSPAFADLNLDGALDLFVVTYVEATDDPPKLCPEPASRDGYIQCSPTLFQASEDVLFLGDGAGGFENVTRRAGTAETDGKGLGIAIFDVDGDHLPEIFIANDGTPNLLYCRVPPSSNDEANHFDVQFVDKAFEKGVAVSSRGKAQAGMGVAVTDVDGDGWLDIFVTNFFGEPNSLFQNRSGQFFDDASNSSGLGPPSRPLLGFGAEFLDADNDGWPDLFVTNGHVDDLSSFTRVPYQMPPLVFRSEHNGRFVNVTPWAGEYCQKNWLGRGVATSDIDRDGKLDLVVSHQRDRSAVLRNETTGHLQSCRLRLIGTEASNRSAFHATVRVEGIDGPPTRQIMGGGSFQSASDRTIHIGMGESHLIPRVSIRWPDGKLEYHANLQPGEYVIIEGQSPVRLSKF